MMKQLTSRQQKILDFIGRTDSTPNRDILVSLRQSGEILSRVTLTRDLDILIAESLIIREGKGRSVHYALSATHPLLAHLDIEHYFLRTQDERKEARQHFDFSIFDAAHHLFTAAELAPLDRLADDFRARLETFSPTLVKKEFERLAIELSWKSSQIEGNTYTLLDTEVLLKEHREVAGHKREEAVMLINHKRAIEYVLERPENFREISRARIEELHELLMRDLSIERGIRSQRVGITGTAFRPLGNRFQIEEAVEKLCALVNKTPHAIEKAFLVLVMLPYIQPFEDGNKRTSRILADALLWAYHYCPLSFRSIDEKEYKKAVILVYELHNCSLMKKLFIEQFLFACENYFAR